MMNELPLNRCVVSVTGGRAGHQWCGNILALRMGRSYDFYDNVNMEEDLKPLIAYFEDYNMECLYTSIVVVQSAKISIYLSTCALISLKSVGSQGSQINCQ